MTDDKSHLTAGAIASPHESIQSEQVTVRKVSFNMSEDRFRELKAMAKARNVSMTEIFAEGVALSDLVNRYRGYSLVFRKIDSDGVHEKEFLPLSNFR